MQSNILELIQKCLDISKLKGDIGIETNHEPRGHRTIKMRRRKSLLSIGQNKQPVKDTENHCRSDDGSESESKMVVITKDVKLKNSVANCDRSPSFTNTFRIRLDRVAVILLFLCLLPPKCYCQSSSIDTFPPDLSAESLFAVVGHVKPKNKSKENTEDPMLADSPFSKSQFLESMR